MQPRRTIAEWLTYFELEPSLNHVFVEGESDQAFYRAMFASLSIEDVEVRTVAEVAISSRSFIPTPYSSGNRSRLIVFSEIIQARLAAPADNVRCIIDKDCDCILPTICSSRFLLRTKFANLLIYFAEFDALRHMILAVYGREYSVEDHSVVVGATKFLFACRICRYYLKPDASAVASQASMLVKDGRLVFDQDHFIERLLLANGLMGQKSTFIEMLKSVLNKMRGDAREYMNFHDFMELLHTCLLRRRLLPSGVNSNELTRIYKAAIDLERMRQDSLSKELSIWLKS